MDEHLTTALILLAACVAGWVAAYATSALVPLRTTGVRVVLGVTTLSALVATAAAAFLVLGLV